MRQHVRYYLHTATSTEGSSGPICVAGFRHKTLTIASTGISGDSYTVKVQGGIGNAAEAPDFSAAQSPSNIWDYIQIIDLQNGAAVNGDTGVTMTTNDVRLFAVNVDTLSFVGATISGKTDADDSGKITVILDCYND